MTKFQKIQKISSIIPVYSTVIVAFVTMFVLKRNKVPFKIWFFFTLTFFLSGIATYLLNQFVMIEWNVIVKIIVVGLILAIANILFVDLQIMSANMRQKDTDGHTSKRMFFVYLAVCGVALIVTAVILFLRPPVEIEDINGNSDTSLAVISEEEILSTSDCYSAYSSYTAFSGSTTNVTGSLKEYDYEEVAFRSQKVSGIKTLQVTNAVCDQLTLKIETRVETGNLEIVIIVDDVYYSSVAANQAISIVLADVAGKTVVVKMAAESAKVDVSVTRNLN